MEKNNEMMELIADAVREELGTGHEVGITEVRRNNGLVLPAVTIREAGDNVAPVVYIDRLMEGITSGEIGAREAAQEVVRIHRKRSGDRAGLADATRNIDRQYILDNVTCQLINAEKNMERLGGMPHREFLDLAAIYRVTVREHESGTVSFAVSNENCEKYGITKMELHTASMRNMGRDGFRVRTIESVIAEMTGIPEEETGRRSSMWVLSNTCACNGATVMLFSEYFDRLARDIKSDLYILPSSIHEVLAVPAGENDPGELRRTVGEVNSGKAFEGFEDEILSGNVYRYSPENSAFSIA